MPPGHPYLTAKLVAQRAEQRRILRSVPDWIVENAEVARPGPRLPDPDRVLVERALRRLADRELEPLRDWLSVWRWHTESEMLDRWFRHAEIGATLEDVAAVVRTEHEERRVVDYPPGLFLAILRVITLLAWADEQAGEYADPRLWRHHAAWRTRPSPPRVARPSAPRVTRPKPMPPRTSRRDDVDFWEPPLRRASQRGDGRSRRAHAPASGDRHQTAK